MQGVFPRCKGLFPRCRRLFPLVLVYLKHDNNTCDYHIMLCIVMLSLLEIDVINMLLVEIETGLIQ